MPLIWLVLALTACSGIGAANQPAPTVTPTGPGRFAAQIVGSDFAVGSNRFTFVIFHNDTAVTDAQPRVYFFSLNGFNALPAGQTRARFLRVTPSGAAGAPAAPGVYVTHTSFDRAGKWGAEIDVTSGGRRHSLQTIFTVSKRSVTPPIGAPAPRSHNPTLGQVPLSQLDSGRPPDTMHRISIARAIALHRPLVILFASAAYCGTFQCVPEITAVSDVQRRYHAQIDFVHIDIFRGARPPALSSTALQWHIPSQPWIFIVDRSGRVAAKFEGPTAESEIESSIGHVLHG